MIRLPRPAALALAVGALLLTPVTGWGADWSSFTPVSDEQLSEERGGFLVADGVAFDFGAVLRTSVDGAVVMETTLTWTPAGAVTQQTIQDPALAGSALDLQTVLTNGDLGKLAGGQQLTLSSGQTQLIQRIAQNGLQNVILNTADNRNLTQDLEVNLTLANATEFQKSVALSQLGLALNRAAAAAGVGGLH